MPARKKLLVSLLVVLAIFLFFPKKSLAQVVINEFQLSPTNSQWIELYNKSESSIDISSWIIDDDGGTEKFIVLSGTSLLSKKCVSFQSSKFNWNATSADKVRLFDQSSLLIEEYSYNSSPGDNISIGRITDGEGNLAVLSATSKDKLNLTGESCLAPTSTPTPTPSVTPEPEPTSTPTSTPTPTPSSTKAIYKINDVKDENGNILSSVQIYVDNTYVHHFAPETITFCDGCSCDGYVACGFGSHTITLQKTGYNNWAEAKTLNSGNNYEVNPVMQVSSSTTSSTSTPTPTPTPKPTPFASPATSFSASSSSKVIATGLSLVLGESVSSTAGAVISPKPKAQAIKSSTAPNLLTPVLLILGALAVLGTGISLFWLKRKKMYNE